MIGRVQAFWNPRVIRYWPPRVPYPEDSRCAHCHEAKSLVFVHSMTCYPDDHDKWMCKECGDQYCDYWQAQWDEYNASRG